MLTNLVKAWHSLVTATGPQNGALKTERKDGDHMDQGEVSDSLFCWMWTKKQDVLLTIWGSLEIMRPLRMSWCWEHRAKGSEGRANGFLLVWSSQDSPLDNFLKPVSRGLYHLPTKASSGVHLGISLNHFKWRSNLKQHLWDNRTRTSNRKREKDSDRVLTKRKSKGPHTYQEVLNLLSIHGNAG